MKDSYLKFIFNKLFNRQTNIREIKGIRSRNKEYSQSSIFQQHQKSHSAKNNN